MLMERTPQMHSAEQHKTINQHQLISFLGTEGPVNYVDGKGDADSFSPAYRSVVPKILQCSIYNIYHENS